MCVILRPSSLKKLINIFLNKNTLKIITTEILNMLLVYCFWRESKRGYVWVLRKRRGNLSMVLKDR